MLPLLGYYRCTFLSCLLYWTVPLYSDAFTRDFSLRGIKNLSARSPISTTLQSFSPPHHHDRYQYRNVQPIQLHFHYSSSRLYAERKIQKPPEPQSPVDSSTKRVIRQILTLLKSSQWIETKHQDHINSPTVTHLFKNTPLATLPNALKLDFVTSWGGKALATIMAEEQEFLGDWKMEKIIEAAGQYDCNRFRVEIEELVGSTPIVVYSFRDCPWCIAAKSLLQSEYSTVDVMYVELEDLGIEGKAIRAELAKLTARTSMPCIFVNGDAIGGYTDGVPCGDGLDVLHRSGRLAELLSLP